MSLLPQWITDPVADGRLERPSWLLYLLVWLCGLIVSVIFLLGDLHDRINKQAAGDMEWLYLGVLGALVIAGCCHQLFVFQSIHDFEVPRSPVKLEFNQWLRCRMEITLRILVIVMLFIVGGEAPLLFKEVMDRMQQPFSSFPFIYPVSSALLFFFLFLWDVGAWYCCKKAPGLNVKKPHSQYFWSDSLALVLWIAVSAITTRYRNDSYVAKGCLFLITTSASLYFFVLIKRVVTLWKHHHKNPSSNRGTLSKVRKPAADPGPGPIGN